MRAKPAPINTPEGTDAAPRGFSIDAHRLVAPKAAAGLYLVATPIGNLGDITLRALQALAGADLIACEDTRVTRKLLDRYAIATPLTPYHEHNAAQARPALLRRIVLDLWPRYDNAEPIQFRFIQEFRFWCTRSNTLQSRANSAVRKHSFGAE